MTSPSRSEISLAPRYRDDRSPLSQLVTGVLDGVVFVASEVMLDLGFDVARIGLVTFIRGCDLLRASQDAYGAGVADLGAAGSPGPGLAASRLISVRLGEPVARGNSMVVALRWEAVGPPGGLFPALDADLTLAPAGARTSALRLDGAYRPPPGALAAGLDQVTLHQVGNATVGSFLGRVAAAMTDPARRTWQSSGDGHRGLPSLPPDAEVS